MFFLNRISPLRALLLAAGLVLGLGAVATSAAAQTASYSVTDFTVAGQGSFTLGYTFKPTTNITVTSVGQWIHTGDVITGIETMGIFDNSGALLFSTPYTQANAILTGNTSGGGQFRYTDVTSLSSSSRILLDNTQYTMAGTDYNGIVIAQATALTANPLINLTSVGLYTSQPFQRPTTVNAFNIYGMNFQFVQGGTAAPSTPEPGSIALLAGLGLSGGLFLKRRKK